METAITTEWETEKLTGETSHALKTRHVTAKVIVFKVNGSRWAVTVECDAENSFPGVNGMRVTAGQEYRSMNEAKESGDIIATMLLAGIEAVS